MKTTVPKPKAQDKEKIRIPEIPTSQKQNEPPKIEPIEEILPGQPNMFLTEEEEQKEPEEQTIDDSLTSAEPKEQTISASQASVEQQIISAFPTSTEQIEKPSTLRLGEYGETLLRTGFSDFDYSEGLEAMLLEKIFEKQMDDEALERLFSYVLSKKPDLSKITTGEERMEMCFGFDDLVIDPKKRNQLATELLQEASAGNCGELANHIYTRLSGKTIESMNIPALKQESDKLDRFLDTIQLPQEGTRRVIRADTTIGHAITLIVYQNEASARVELVQAWTEGYNVREWLEEGGDSWSIEEFKQKLGYLIDGRQSNPDAYDTALMELFKARPNGTTSGKKSAELQTGRDRFDIDYFAYEDVPESKARPEKLLRTMEVLTETEEESSAKSPQETKTIQETELTQETQPTHPEKISQEEETKPTD